MAGKLHVEKYRAVRTFVTCNGKSKNIVGTNYNKNLKREIGSSKESLKRYQ